MAEKSRPTRQEVLSGKGKPDRSRKTTLMNEKKTQTFVPGANAVGKEIHENWYKADGSSIEDIEGYILNYLASKDKYDLVDITIGTDGLAHGAGKGKHVIKLLSVICFVNKGKGAHVVMRRESQAFNRFIGVREKLRMEANKTIELIIYLINLNIKPIAHFDLNSDPMHESNKVYKEIKGWVSGLGCQVEYKPLSPAASFAADHYL